MTANNLFGYFSTNLLNVPSNTTVPFDNVFTNGTAIQNLGGGFIGLNPNQTYEVSYTVREQIDNASGTNAGADIHLNGALFVGGSTRVNGVSPTQLVELTKTVIISTTVNSVLNLVTLNQGGGTNDILSNSSISVIKLA